MRPSSLASEHPGLFGGVLERGPVAAAVSDRAWLQAMLDAEAALARALARAGLISDREAETIASACQADRFDPDQLGAAAAASGNPVVPLVRALADAVRAPAAAHVHWGATSQDVLDTAAMLVARRALVPLLGDLAAAQAAAWLAVAHADAPMAGRTLLQHAVPITFGLKAAGWMAGLADARAGLERVRLAAQLGGAAGTLAALGDAGPTVLGHYARELTLEEPVLCWHTIRTRPAELAGALAVAAGAIGKVARDVTLLAQTEVAEAHEAAPGGSSAMPHKANPVAAVAALASARQAPGLAATLFAAMVQEHDRAAGAWHAEWRPFSELLRATGSAANWLRTCLEDLQVDPGRMRANLDLLGGLPMAEQIAGVVGREAVHEAVQRAATSGRPFAKVIAEDVSLGLGPAEIVALLDPSGYVGAAQAFIDRALKRHG